MTPTYYSKTFQVNVKPLGGKYLAEVMVEKSGMRNDNYFEIIGSGLETTPEAAMRKAVFESGILGELNPDG